jgi:hypothetical protein
MKVMMMNNTVCRAPVSSVTLELDHLGENTSIRAAVVKSTDSPTQTALDLKQIGGLDFRVQVRDDMEPGIVLRPWSPTPGTRGVIRASELLAPRAVFPCRQTMGQQLTGCEVLIPRRVMDERQHIESRRHSEFEAERFVRPATVIGDGGFQAMADVALDPLSPSGLALRLRATGCTEFVLRPRSDCENVIGLTWLQDVWVPRGVLNLEEPSQTGRQDAVTDEYERCGETSVLWPEEDAIDVTCCLRVGHQPSRMHCDSRMGDWDERNV